MSSAGYTPSNVLAGSPQLVNGSFAPGTIINQAGVVNPSMSSSGGVITTFPPTVTQATAVPTLGTTILPMVALPSQGGSVYPTNNGSTQFAQIASSPNSYAAPMASSSNGYAAPMVSSSNGYVGPLSSSPNGYAAPLTMSQGASLDSAGNLTTRSPSARPRSPRSASPRSSLTPRSRSPTRTNNPPVMASTSVSGPSLAASVLASQLLDRGVVMMDQIVVRNQQGEVAEQFIKGVTKYGDKVLILLDHGQLEAPNVEGSLSANSTLVPYSLKTGVHQCSKSELCGVAFDCQGEVCTLIRKRGSLDPQEITFKLKGTQRFQLPVGVVMANDAVNAYPVVLWSEFWGAPNMTPSEVRTHMLMMLGYIDIVSQRINAYISRSVDGLLEKTVDAAKHLKKKLKAIDIAVFHSDNKGARGLRQDLEGSVNKLRAFTEGYQKLDPIPEDYQELARLTEINLYHRKEYLRQLNSLINSTVGYVDLINNINQQLQTVLEQIAHLKALNDAKPSEA